MTRILGIDPGPTESAYVVYDGTKPVRFGKVDNEHLRTIVLRSEWLAGTKRLVIEQIACMGMAVGAEVFETAFASGQFAQAWGGEWDRLKRGEVKLHLCGNTRAKDGNIRQALIDRFGPGKEKAIGKKKTPGPLYGISGDCWQALALAICYYETKLSPKAQTA